MDAAFTSSVDAEVTSMLEEYFPDDVTVTVTPTSTVTIPDVTVTVTPTPTAVCYYEITDIFYTFVITNINNWAENDSGAALKKQESGCGAITDWSWHDAANGKGAHVIFNLPLFLTAGCVERAIVSAGGPKVSCIYTGSESIFPKRRARRAGTAIKRASIEAPRVMPTYTYRSEAGIAPSQTYVPQVWNSSIPAAPLNEPDGHAVVKNWVTPTPDNQTSVYTMYTVVYPTAYVDLPSSGTRNFTYVNATGLPRR
jgi:hypothetical protein